MAKAKKKKAAKAKWCVFTGKKGKTKGSCHRKKSDAKKRANSHRKHGGHARVRRVGGHSKKK